MESRITIPFTLHGIEENLTVEYTQGTDPKAIGYDALRGFPIDKICCIGYPAEIFDAPCCNLAGCKHLKWTAYTYLVDLPSRMNGNKLEFLAGYSWGYEEDENGPQRLLPLEVLTKNEWKRHATELNEEDRGRSVHGWSSQTRVGSLSRIGYKAEKQGTS